jgi:hypothetical protein
LSNCSDKTLVHHHCHTPSLSGGFVQNKKHCRSIFCELSCLHSDGFFALWFFSTIYDTCDSNIGEGGKHWTRTGLSLDSVVGSFSSVIARDGVGRRRPCQQSNWFRPKESWGFPVALCVSCSHMASSTWTCASQSRSDTRHGTPRLRMRRGSPSTRSQETERSWHCCLIIPAPPEMEMSLLMMMRGRNEGELMEKTQTTHHTHTYHGPQLESDTQGTFGKEIGRSNGANLGYRLVGRILPETFSKRSMSCFIAQAHC